MNLSLQNSANCRSFITLALGFLLAVQLVYSFRFPSVGNNANWLPITDYLPKFSQEGHDNFLVKTFLPLISKDYRLNSDVGEYLLVARNFNAEYLEGHQYLNRPLYPFLIFLFSKLTSRIAAPSYGVLFGAAIFINIIFAYLTAVLLFNVLRHFYRFKIAFLSSILFIFSPFAHSLIVEPMPEMLTAFGVMLSLALLYFYIRKPRLIKLTLFSLLGGVFMLGKMFFATPLLILMLALYYKRYREGAIFLLLFSLPVFGWYLWVTKIWGIPYYVLEIQQWNMGIWIFGIFDMPFLQIAQQFVSAIPNFITTLFKSFVFLPVIFAVIGWEYMRDKPKRVFCGSFILAVFTLVFLVHLYLYRHTFMLFPIVFPLALLAVEKIADRLRKQRVIFSAACVLAIIAVSSINIYSFYYYV